VWWFSQTNNERAPWWQVDLEAIRTVREVVLWRRDDGGGPNQLANFVIYTSTNGQDWREFAREPDSALRPSRYQGRVDARFVRVQLIDQNYLAIMEAEVFGY